MVDIFFVTISPAHAYQGDAADAARMELREHTIPNVAFRLLQTEGGGIIDTMTGAMLRNMRNVFTFLMAMDMNRPPPIGMYSKLGFNAEWLDFNIIKFRKELFKVFVECECEVMKVLVSNKHIGSSVVQHWGGENPL
jgi:hypothetical protein